MSAVTAAPAQVGSDQRAVRRRPRRLAGRALLTWIAEHALLLALAVVFVSPVVFVVFTSVMHSNQALTGDLVPRSLELGNYVRIFSEAPLATWYGNTVLYAVLSTAFMLVASVPAGYALAKLRFRGSNVIFLAIVVAMLLPPQVTAVPVYVMWSELGLTGSLWPLILPNLLGDAFSVFLIRQFFLTIPTDFANAARMDGASEWGVLWRVMIPMARPGIAAAAIFLFFRSWNDYYGPLLYASENQAAWPVAYGLATYRGIHGTDWAGTMALTVVVLVPVVVVFFLAQKVFVEGIALSGVKG
ncbi:carbohydrate ABC transporter permease [Labedella phragmitis]|uniref:Carbohydrate ABC transporter permease n=1 Tax=Labedella phragmitis TaxID=2498849 RepID=A0A3S3ZAS1_9MICO|nr:carbohydrate ABC transporter permease [Labedella phragmitis]RWZ51434.1 carbohydrate ABC transporter permease [Labedella phragmitis]